MQCIFRATQGSIEFKFTDDCPNDVKYNVMQRCLSGAMDGKPVVVPPLFRQWVIVIDDRTSGLMLPFVGFMSGERIARIRSHLRRTLRL
jgi:hypothetical protein